MLSAALRMQQAVPACGLIIVAKAHTDMQPPPPPPQHSQVLITLQAVRQPVKPTDAVLRTKQLPEAAALEAEVYAALEATPDNGAAFAAGRGGNLDYTVGFGSDD